MAFYYVEPEVAGRLGPNSVLDTTVHPPVVSRLEYEFSDWLGDGIVETFPCYIVTEDLAGKISDAALDFGLSADHRLVVSRSALSLLRRGRIDREATDGWTPGLPRPMLPEWPKQ